MKVAHAVRAYGGLTEPFIAQRVATGDELWTERLIERPDIPVRVVHQPFIGAGGPGDRLYHRFPLLSALARNSYTAMERSSRPDVIHAHYMTTGYLVGRATHAPLVVSTYGFDVTVVPRRTSWHEPIRWLRRRAARMLVEGPYMRATVLKMGFPEDRVIVVPIAAALGGIEPRPPREPETALRFLLCGRLVEKKGVDIALAGWARIVSSLPVGSTLAIVGSGPLETPLRLQARQLGLGASVLFLGALRRADYLQRLREADVLLAPSRTARNGDGEGGAPTAILDAQATGVIVVGSTHADIPFLVTDGTTGYLFDEADSNSLVSAIERCLADRERWHEVARAARIQVSDRHADSVVARQLARVHEQVLAA